MAATHSDGKVALLVTMDLEYAPDHDPHGQERILAELREDARSRYLPLTIFATAAAAERFSSEVSRLSEGGHEIGCHGVSHGPDEDYTRMTIDRARTYIREATNRLAAVTGSRPVCFRGPSMTTSTTTQQVLQELGYEADFSVCPQRLDATNSRGWRPGWLIAPRRAYLPSEDSPFREGTRRILVVPLSGVGVPFLSGSLYLFGLGFMRTLFRVLLSEARRTGMPIVYLFHSYEFTEFTGRPKADTDRGRRKGGQKRLHRLYMKDRDRRYRLHGELLDHMLSQPGITPLTGRDYASKHGGVRP